MISHAQEEREWAYSAFKPGNQTAQDFDQNSGSWTMVKKFSDSGGYEDGNGDTWIEYQQSFNSGTATQVSVGYKLGSTGVAPKVMWDSLRIE